MVESSQSMTVTLAGNPVPAQIIGLDTSGDLALLSSDRALPGPYIPLGASDPQVGERVAALGFPLGNGLTMTQGSVSALDQSIALNQDELSGLVQTDTALNPGNSGGPLIALDGTARGIVEAGNVDANATGFATSPAYATPEVQRWIAAPGSHPLPLCGGSTDQTTTTTAAPAQDPDELTAANALGSLLSESAAARSAVVAATKAVGSCQADPVNEQSVLSGAVSQRQTALAGLASVNTGALPGGQAMLDDLNGALQSSDTADQDYISWFGDIEGDPCPYPTTSDGNFQAASAASMAATADKSAFLALWNPLAQALGLTQYSQSQI